MIKITKLGQGVNEKIIDYYARSQQLRRKIKAQIGEDNLGEEVIDGVDRLLLKHFILIMRKDIRSRMKCERSTTMEQDKEIRKRQEERMEEEP